MYQVLCVQEIYVQNPPYIQENYVRNPVYTGKIYVPNRLCIQDTEMNTLMEKNYAYVTNTTREQDEDKNC